MAADGRWQTAANNTLRPAGNRIIFPLLVDRDKMTFSQARFAVAITVAVSGEHCSRAGTGNGLRTIQ